MEWRTIKVRKSTAEQLKKHNKTYDQEIASLIERASLNGFLDQKFDKYFENMQEVLEKGLSKFINYSKSIR